MGVAGEVAPDLFNSLSGGLTFRFGEPYIGTFQFQLLVPVICCAAQLTPPFAQLSWVDPGRIEVGRANNLDERTFLSA